VTRFAKSVSSRCSTDRTSVFVSASPVARAHHALLALVGESPARVLHVDGAVLLAAMPVAEQRTTTGESPLVALTSSAPSRKDIFEPNWRRSPSRGWALNDQETRDRSARSGRRHRFADSTGRTVAAIQQSPRPWTNRRSEGVGVRNWCRNCTRERPSGGIRSSPRR